MSRTILYLIVIIVVLCSCGKEESDYRKKFTGDYTFTVIQEYWTYGQPDIFDTLTYEGNIRFFSDEDLSKDLYTNDISINVDRTITIEFMSNGLIITEIEENGEFVTKSGHHYYHFGEFINDNELEFSVLGLGGLGAGYNYEIHGMRK